MSGYREQLVGGKEPTKGVTGVVQRVRLTQGEYKALEKAVERMMPALTSSDQGSLGMRVGSDMVLRALREGFIHAV